MIDEANQTEETVETVDATDSTETDPTVTAAPAGDVPSETAATDETAAETDPITGDVMAEDGEAIAAEVVEDTPEEEPPATLDDLDLDDSAEVSEETTPEAGAEDTDTTSYQAAAMADLARESEGLRVQLEASTGQYARLSADFENFRKRTQKEREEQSEKIKCDTIRELLAVVDNFERARSFIKPQNDSEMNIHKSYQGIYKQLVDSLKRLGVSPMRPEGQEFDPNLHEAVMREVSEKHPEDVVIEELQRGYTVGDRVLRHAMVKVAAPGSGTAVETATDA